MISAIKIEYRRIGVSEWKLYKYVSVDSDGGGAELLIQASEILLLEKAFGEFFKFRLSVYVNSPIHVMIYEEAREWLRDLFSLEGAVSNYDIWCRSCGSKMTRKRGKHGTFWGCTAYPMCTFTMSDRDAALQDDPPDDPWSNYGIGGDYDCNGDFD